VIFVEPIILSKGIAIGTKVELPKTRLLIISTQKGYIMCGILDVKNLDAKLSERKIAAARVTGVKTFEDMLNAKIELATAQAKKLGIYEKQSTGREALNKMF
jgi:uncharacterized protein YunC (DUF1805 family)